MKTLIEQWDGEAVIIRHDQLTDAWIFIAIHSSRLGPASGGTRMKHYPDQESALADALRLASGMTYKFAVPGIKRGGGKAVISIPEGLAPAARRGLLKRYGELIHQLGGYYQTGPDVGTSSTDMDIIAETGSPHVFARSQDAGGAGSSGPITALGVYTGIRVACERVFGDASLKNRTILVQGGGSVGKVLIEHLRNAEAEVMFSDVDDEIINHFRDELGLQFVLPEDVYATACDVFAPCALGSVLDESTIPRLQCRIIAGGANNQLAKAEDAEKLRARNILYAPDYVINVGGAMAIPGIEIEGWSQAEAEMRVKDSVRQALERIFEMAEVEGITTDDAARRLAEEHLFAQ